MDTSSLDKIRNILFFVNAGLGVVCLGTGVTAFAMSANKDSDVHNQITFNSAYASGTVDVEKLKITAGSENSLTYTVKSALVEKVKYSISFVDIANNPANDKLFISLKIGSEELLYRKALSEIASENTKIENRVLAANEEQKLEFNFSLDETLKTNLTYQFSILVKGEGKILG